MTISSKWNEAPGAVTLIDAHHHLWDLKANRYPFLTDRPDPHFFLGSYEAIRRDYLPEDYLRDSSAHNVLTTVHCEAEMDRANKSAKRGG
jgi:predicted TIM-barrel fold metal-dependent hydrolase